MVTRSNRIIEVNTDRSMLSAIMKWSSPFSGLMIATALLLVPLMAAAESSPQTGVRSGKFIATAHVNFRIIIPTAVYLSVGSSNDRSAADDAVSIMSNSRTMTLRATVRTSDDEGSDTRNQTSTNSAVARPTPAPAAPLSASSDDAGTNVIRNSARGKIITRDERCVLRDTHGSVNVNTTPVICTVSMP